VLHFADRLCAAIQRKGNPLCVGLDPRWESLPDEIRDHHRVRRISSVAAAFEEFCLRVLDIVAPLVPVVKPQSAFFEMCGPAGMISLCRIIAQARKRGLITILDSKRGDIASTATAYAEAAVDQVHFGDREYPIWNADAVTINPYLGRDAVEPFLTCARRAGAGVFVLVRTSNPGAGLFQDLEARKPGSNEPPRPFFQHVAEAVRSWSQENLGHSGYGDVGAVIGATYPSELSQLRQAMAEVIFLVPGFGVQGGTAADVLPAFRSDGLGAVINSSRGILFPSPPSEPDWERCIEQATRSAISALPQSTSGPVQ
jgi:orotidine-5'-phosphate decarboxylase